MPDHSYTAFGMLIHSEISLALPPADKATPVDWPVEIVYGPVPIPSARYAMAGSAMPSSLMSPGLPDIPLRTDREGYQIPLRMARRSDQYLAFADCCMFRLDNVKYNYHNYDNDTKC